MRVFDFGNDYVYQKQVEEMPQPEPKEVRPLRFL
jgi:hypothetical protein